jgi:hypothetical protein
MRGASIESISSIFFKGPGLPNKYQMTPLISLLYVLPTKSNDSGISFKQRSELQARHKINCPKDSKSSCYSNDKNIVESNKSFKKISSLWGGGCWQTRIAQYTRTMGIERKIEKILNDCRPNLVPCNIQSSVKSSKIQNAKTIDSNPNMRLPPHGSHESPLLTRYQNLGRI